MSARPVDLKDGRKLPVVWIDVAIDDMKLDPFAFRVYVRIARRAARGECFESVPNIAAACGMDVRRCRKALRDLQASSLIEVTSRPGTTALITLNGAYDDDGKPRVFVTAPDQEGVQKCTDTVSEGSADLHHPPVQKCTTPPDISAPPPPTLDLRIQKKDPNEGYDARTALAVMEPVPVAPKKRTRKPAKPKETTAGSAVWDAYAYAYANRYGRPPVRNGKQNALCTQLADRLGADAAFVAAFYVTHGARFYVQALHPLGILVRDCEAMHTQWAAGHQVTEALARKIDTASEGDAMAARVQAKIAAKYGGGQ